MTLFKLQILSLLACLSYILSFQNDSQAGELLSIKFVEDYKESYNFLDNDMNEKIRLLRSSNSMHYQQNSELQNFKHNSSSSKKSKQSSKSSESSKSSKTSKKSSKKGSKKSSSRNNKNGKKSSNKSSSSSKSSSRSSSIRLVNKKRASSSKKKIFRSSSNSKQSSSRKSTKKPEINIVANLPPIKHIKTKTSSSKDHAIINVMVIDYDNEKKNSKISSKSASSPFNSESSSSVNAKKQVSAPTRVPTVAKHEIMEKIQTHTESNSSKSSKTSKTDQVITISYVDSRTSQSSKSSSKGNEYKGSAKSASKVGCSYSGCDTGSKTSESGNYYNDIESVQYTEEKQEKGKSIKSEKGGEEKQGDKAEKSPQEDKNKSVQSEKGAREKSANDDKNKSVKSSEGNGEKQGDKAENSTKRNNNKSIKADKGSGDKQDAKSEKGGEYATLESGEYYNEIGSAVKGKSVKSDRGTSDKQGDKDEKYAKVNENKSPKSDKGTSDKQSGKSGKKVESTAGSKTLESGEYYNDVGSVKGTDEKQQYNTKTSNKQAGASEKTGKGTRTAIFEFDNNGTQESLGKGAKSATHNYEDIIGGLMNSNDGGKSNSGKSIKNEKNGPKTISIVELPSEDRVSIPKSSAKSSSKSSVLTSPLPVNLPPAMPPSIAKGTAKGGKSTSTEKSADKINETTNNSNEEPQFNSIAKPLSTIQNVDKASDSNIYEAIVNKSSNSDNSKFICSSMNQTQASTSHIVLKFKYLIEATSENLHQIEEELEEILIEGIAKDLCNEELIKEVNTDTDRTLISSCIPQESSSICRNVQGEISLEITDEALNRNVAQIELTLEKSFSAHMPDALNISGLNRLDVTEIELKGEDFVLKGKITPAQTSKDTNEEQQVPLQEEEQGSNNASPLLSTSKQGKISKINEKSLPSSTPAQDKSNKSKGNKSSEKSSIDPILSSSDDIPSPKNSKGGKIRR